MGTLRRLRLETDDGWVQCSPEDHQIRQAVEDVAAAGEGWVVLARPDGSFLQAERHDNGKWELGFCDFPADRSRRAWPGELATDTIGEALLRYADGDPSWKLPFGWHWTDVVERHSAPAEGVRPPQPGELEKLREVMSRQQMRRIRRAGWLTAGVAINAAAAWGLAATSDGYVRYSFLALGTAATLATLGLYRLTYRCPSCNRHLGWGRKPRCPHCNVRLR